MIKRSRQYLTEEGLPPADMLRSVLQEYQAELGHLRRLRDMYNARSPILSRERRAGLPNNRIAHPYARYITAVATGYLIGKPVTYSTSEPNETMQQIQDIFRRGSEPAENVQLARDQSIYGKGVEYVHIDNSDSPTPHTTAISPLNAFVVYSNTYDMEPLFGVYFVEKSKADGSPDGWSVWVMSDKVIAQYDTLSLTVAPTLLNAEPHYFGGVPIIEYWNDENEKGDFEWVLPEIEAYDKLQSDRVNDKEQFVEKLLVITGAVLETDERGREPMQQLKEDHALQLPDTQSRAEYLTSQMDEVGNQILRNDLLADIHKLSMVPDMSDQNFASNASGVAMKYKLWGLEQLVNTKKQWFAEGLRARLKLYINFLVVKGYAPLDVADIKITFTHALPVNVTENAQTAKTARDAGIASRRTGISMLHQGEEWSDSDIDAELDVIAQEITADALGAIQKDTRDSEGI